MRGRLVIMGSGETAPTMVKPHREVSGATGDGPAIRDRLGAAGVEVADTPDGAVRRICED